MWLLLLSRKASYNIYEHSCEAFEVILHSLMAAGCDALATSIFLVRHMSTNHQQQEGVV